jgi:hypothetical protein
VSALGRLHTRAALEAFDVDDYVVDVPAASTPGELEARDAVFGTALAEIDDAMTRVMRIELEHALADDTSIATPTRKVFAGTINAYAANVELLASRRPSDALRAKVFEAAMATARDSTADADARARDRKLDDTVRKRWSAWRRELEAVASDPTRVTAPIATRLASWPEQIDEPAPEAEVTFADMIEMD